MDTEVLVHQTEIEVHGDRYTINVFCRSDGRHFAKTPFGEEDIIINDGGSLEEVLDKHAKVLPLAISSRQMFHKLSGSSRRSNVP